MIRCKNKLGKHFYIAGMGKLFTEKKLLIIITAVAMLYSCQKVPVTGRSQLSFIPASEMQSMSYTNYKEFLGSNKISSNTAQTAMVKNVGVRIQQAVETYMAQHNLSSRLKGFQWEFNLVEDPAVNAWCMPGGKVVVYTGILPVVKDETGLAVVMGHEVAHAIANHGGERMSQGLITQMGGMGLALALQNKPSETQALFNTAFNVGSQVGILLPYSRLHESEADHLGLIFMAMAGYDPNEAVEFWKRMKSQSAGQKPPELLSTHPSDDKRIEDLRKEVPEAMKYYAKKN
jgi:predicted Zn-dependent protease